MADEDTRSLPAVAQTALRNQAVRAVLRGMTQAQAARVFGAHPNAVNRWIKRYQERLSGARSSPRSAARPRRRPASKRVRGTPVLPAQAAAAWPDGRSARSRHGVRWRLKLACTSPTPAIVSLLDPPGSPEAQLLESEV